MRIYSKRSANPKDYTQNINEHDDYNFISIDLTPIPWNCDKIKYSISQINFTADYYITTPDDYIDIEFTNDPYEVKRYHFEYLKDFDMNNIATYLVERVFNREMAVMIQDNGTISLHHNIRSFNILDITNRARWILGTRQPVPIISTYEEQNPGGYNTFGDEIPSATFGNLLYLTSLQGETVSTTTPDNIPISPSIIYRINQFMRPGLPVIINKKQSKIITNSVSKINIQLTDIYLEPIILLSRLYVAIEVKPFSSY
jgi:hypothetical protein